MHSTTVQLTMVKDHDMRKSVWENYTLFPELINNPCFCCGNDITVFTFELGHVISRYEGGPFTPENLRPICSEWNKVSQKQHMFEFRRDRYPIYPCFDAGCDKEADCGWFC